MLVYIPIGLMLIFFIGAGFMDFAIDKSCKLLMIGLVFLLLFASLIYYELNFATVTNTETKLISRTVDGIDVVVCDSDIINLNSKLERDIEEETVIIKKVIETEYAFIGGTITTTSYHISE